MSEQEKTLDEFVGKGDSSLSLELGPIQLAIPQEWDTRKFSDVFNLIAGNSYSGEELSEEDNGGRIFLTLKSVNKGGGFNWDSIKYYTGEVNERELVETGEILIANTDVTQDGDVVGYSFRVPDFEANREVAASMDLSILRPRSEDVNLPYIEYLLQTDYIHSRMRAFSAGSTVLHLNTDLVESLTLPVPALEEQRKIASVLYTVDQAIQKTEEIINRLERLLVATRRNLMRKGTGDMQLVGSDSRFGKIPKNWELKRLNDVTNVVGGSTPSTEEPKYWNGSIPWATPTDLTELEGSVIEDTNDYITEEGLASASTHLIPPESVLMTSRATIGKCAVNGVEMATNQGFQNLVPSEDVDTWYLYYRIKEEAAYLDSVGSGSTFSEVSKSTVQKIRIPVPPLDEQRTIAKRLRSIDDVRYAERDYRRKLQRVKQGLIQDLLSGEVRTHDKDIEPVDDVLKHG